ncbi:hypothetical protein GCM10010912_55510 [Paenibacillus albidus]|uniref:Uncharacterized protein n=1 Tax=Paenibacillus albidus TaxID=2041023 RepID=A0A917CYM9_9BACL|nr:hypothetical protein [Paenibacillus albidus]GGG03675.1 hypothetical protein GCM10010912_55510 [Paenibacillus albidus]
MFCYQDVVWTSQCQKNDQSELGFGAIIIYYVEEQKIKLNFTGSVGTSPITACEFTATYTFNRDKNEFIVDQIDVNPVEE